MYLSSFHCAKLKNILRADPESQGRIIFGPKNDTGARNKFFFTKSINVIFMYFLAPFNVQNLKKIFGVNSELRRSTNPKHFFQKHINKPCSLHSYLSTLKKIKFGCHYINEIVTIKQNLHLIGQGQF